MRSIDGIDRPSWARTAFMVALALVLLGATASAQEGEDEAYDEEPTLQESVTIDETATVGEVDESIPWDLRQQIEVPLQKRVEALLQEKNAAGIKNRRGQYSRRFVKVGDDAYRVTFTERTADKFRLKIDRYWLTVQRQGSDFEIVGEELRDTYDGMRRSWIAPEFYSFDSFEVAREGLVIRGGKGNLFPEFLENELRGVFVVADGMSYAYAPPADVPIGYYDQVYREWSKRLEKQKDFVPTVIEIACDPESCASILGSFRGLGKIEPTASDETTWESAVAPASVPASIREPYDEEVRKGNKFYRENPFAGFQPARETENRFWQIQVKKNDNNWFAVTYDSFNPEEVSVFAYFRGWFGGPVFSYYSEDTRKSGADPYELELRPDREARYFNLHKVDGTIEAALEDPESYKAKVDYGITVTRDLNRKILPFFVATIPRGENEEARRPSLNINLVEYKGEELTFVRTGSFNGFILLPAVIKAGEKIDLRMEFETRAISKVNPAFSQMYRGGWLPFVRFGDMIDEFALTIKVPSQYKTLGIGRKVSDVTEGDVNTTKWVADSPVVFPTIIFGKYAEVSSDDAYQAKTLDGKPIPVTVHVDDISMQTLEIDVASYDDAKSFSDDFRAGARGIRTKQLKPIGVQAATAIDYYTQISGVDYPYGELNLVNDPAPALYGQAPSSLIYLGSSVFRGEGTMSGDTVMGGGGTNISKFLKSVTAHEVGHQWWGSAIANANQRNYWFVESMAEFFSALWLEQAFGRKEYLEQVDEWRRRILDVEQFFSVQRATSDWGGSYPFPGAAYQAAVYNKGPYAFHILRSTFGDEKFFPFLKQFCQELHRRGEIVTLDIQRVAEETLGGVDANGNRYNVDLGWFFDQWIRGVGIPEYSFNYDVRKNEEGNWIVEGTVKQRVVMGHQRAKVVMPDTYYRGVVPITVAGKKQEYRQRLVVEGPETKFTLVVPERPQKITLNKEGEILALDVLENRPFGS